MVGHWWVVVVVAKGGWKGPCTCLPGLGMTLSPSSPAVDRVCMLGAGDMVL